ncbi:MAG: hypothetical protein JXB25_10520 [Deltaproteobacteria bacterium]|nr:hypothetical protein [Deltaproteobacteria bacterium]
MRTRTAGGEEGRWLVGRTLITGLDPGAEADGLRLQIDNLRDRVESMNVLVPSETVFPEAEEQP